jgi:L-fuculose-phosphate aldolase
MENKSNILNNLISLSNEISKFVVGYEGNVSGKFGNTLFIKKSGSRLKNINITDFVQYDLFGNQLDNFSEKGSMELDFHSYLLGYKNVNYVCHVHPVNCLKILCTDRTDKFSNFRLFPDQVIFNFSRSCVVPYAKPGKELSEKIKDCVENFLYENNFFPKLILLQNHGIITCGQSINECLIISEICEKSAEIFIDIYDKNPNYLTEHDINSLLNDEKEKYRIKKL